MIRWAPRRGNQMRRREFLGLLGSAAIAWPVAAQQRSAKLPRIGYLTDRVSPGEFDEAFLRGLHELGYVEGRTIAIEYRWAEGKAECRRGWACRESRPSGRERHWAIRLCARAHAEAV